MTNLKASLNKIIGRLIKMLKEHLFEFLLGLALLDMASVLQIAPILSSQDKWLAKVLLGLGAIFLIIAVLISHAQWKELKRKEKEAKHKEEEEAKKADAKFTAQIDELKTIRTDITTSINTLVNEIRRERNEHRDSNE